MTLRPRKTMKNCLDASKRSFRHFCENTSINGVKHIVADRSHWIERLAWVLVLLAGLSFSSYFCWLMWRKWDESPIITSVESNRYPLKNTSFPAVTICSVNKVSGRNLREVLSTDPRFDGTVPFDLIQDTLRYMTKLDRAHLNEEPLKKLSDLYKSVNVSPNDLFDLLTSSTPSCGQLIMDCVWQGNPESCLNYFSFLPTDDGICCTFNGANYSDPDLGIEPSGNGYKMGLAVVLNADLADYSVTTGKFNGFKVLIHSPEEFPDVSDRGFVVGPGEEVFVAVKSISTFNAKEVTKSFPLQKRGCRVDGEVKLKYFNEYSRSACEVECATQLMLNRCKCRPYFFRADRGTPLCDLAAYPCLNDAYNEVKLRGDEVCHCLPPCTEEWYDPEISSAPFPGNGFNLTRTFKRMVDSLNLSEAVDATEYFKSNVAVLHVYFKEKTGFRYKTDVRFGTEDFISAMGGLLSLGIGVSVIGIIEILYYACLHVHVRPPARDDDDEESTEALALWRNYHATGSSTTTLVDPSIASSLISLKMEKIKPQKQLAD